MSTIATSTLNPQMTGGDLDRLLYRRQFLLTNSPDFVIDGSRLRIGEEFFLSVHGDLELTHLEVDDGSLTLLGMAFDPASPSASNLEILKGLERATPTLARLVEEVDLLGGRWVLIWRRGEQLVVMHDACGQRQICFTRNAQPGQWMCGSEAALLALKLGLQMDPEAVEFIQSRKTDPMEIYWMPGDTTLYREIAALLPNHLLNVRDRQSKRYWPRSPGIPSPIDEALTRTESRLMGMMASAANRYPLVLSMTAGWDSRLILALNRASARIVQAFTISYPGSGIKAMDVVVPARLLNQLGMTHRVIEYPPLDNAEFREVFRHNNATANDVYCRDSQALHEHLEDGRVCVTGDAAEIFKCYYQAHQTDEISPKLLAKLSRLGMHPFVVNAFASWLVTARGLPIDTLDLFCWEQMAGRWQAKVRAEYDIVQESFSPLNQRALLVDILGVDRALRQGPGFFFLQRLIERLWPEVLAEPINPPEARSLPRRIASSLKRSALRAISWVSVDTGMNLSAGGWPPCHAAPRDDFKL